MRCKLKYLLLCVCVSIFAIPLTEVTAHAQDSRGPYILMASEVNGGAVKATGGPYTLLGSVSPPPIGAGTFANGPYEGSAGTAVTIVNEDCNANGIPDDDDIAASTSEDCNGDGIPDECELDEDCNGNLVKDICDIGAGTSLDCNHNLIPDECEVPPIGPPESDCNNNGIPDDCDIAAGTSLDCQFNGVPDECDIDPLDPDGNGEVSKDCQPDGVPDECDIDAGTSEDCQPNAIPDECETDCQPNDVPDDCDIDLTDPDGNGEISEDCQPNGIPDECDIANCPPGDPDCDDCNENGVPDWCDINEGTSVDCEPNGIPDECETDCNANGISDACDLADGTSHDCDNNGVPDECEIGVSSWRTQDCNRNRTPDLCDIAYGTSADADGDGIPDECPIVTCLLAGDVAPTGASIPMHLFVENVTDLRMYLITITIQKTSGDGALSVDCPDGVTIDDTRPDYVFFGLASNPNPDCPNLRLGSSLDAGGVSVGATPAYLGTYMLDISADAELGDTFRMSVHMDGVDSLLWDSNFNDMGFAAGPPCDLTVGAYDPHLTEAVGSRYLQITPGSGAAAMAFWVTLQNQICVEQYLDFDPDPILTAMGIVRLVDTPVFKTPADWGTVYLSDEEIVPDMTYEVQAEWPKGERTGAVSAKTWLWADVNNSGGRVNEDDLLCLLEGMADIFTTCSLFADDLVGDLANIGAVTNGDVDLDDYLVGLDAFFEDPYPYADPCDLRSNVAPPPDRPSIQPNMTGLLPRPPRPVVTITAEPESDHVHPGELISVDVYVSRASDLRGCQVALDITGGTQGELALESLFVDTNRTDYVFAGLQDFHATNLARRRLVDALAAGGINSAAPKYLGTYAFRATSNAEGIFRVQLRPADTYLRDSDTRPIAVQLAVPASIYVAPSP